MPEAVARPGTGPHTRHGLLDSLAPLLQRWLPHQRWFAGKGRPITGFDLVSATELLPPTGPRRLIHLLVRVRQPTSGTEAPAPRPADCYQLLVGVHRALPAPLAPALIGHATEGPLRGLAVYEALYDARLAEVLLAALRSRARIGTLRFEHDPEVTLPPGLPPRVLGAEQSNSSLVYGDTFILKLLRRVVDGVNPDLELPLVLARDGCRQVPAPAAWFVADSPNGPKGQVGPAGPAGPPAAVDDGDTPRASVLGVLTPYLRGAEDGWELALAALAAGRPFTEEAHALGRATAAVHASLARSLPTVSPGRPGLAELARAMADRLEAAVQVVPELGEFAPRLHRAFSALSGLDPRGLCWSAQRVHGDLHLGQCLRQPSGEWSVIDFEGEPARPLAERRLPQLPLRDVAGMLRSFDYAARSGNPWSPDWATACRTAYCAGYAEVSGRDPRADPVLLRAYETDKAVYEVVYESRNRPDWVFVPMAAVRRLAAAGEHPAGLLCP